MSEKFLDRLAKVLALAENATTEAEADAYMKKAQQMSTEHSIDLAVARRHVAKTQRRETPIMRTIQIGAAKAVGNAKRINLFIAIAGVNDVRCNIAHNSTYVIAFGFPSDIDVVETLYAHIVPQMVSSATAYLRTGVHRNEVVYDPRTKKRRAPSGKAARLTFYNAFTTRVGERLWKARYEAEQVAEAARLDALAEAEANIADGLDAPEAPVESVGTALVLADKKAEIDDFYAETSNAKGSWKGNKRKVATPNSARAAGRDAGSKARLTSVPVLPHGKKTLAASSS